MGVHFPEILIRPILNIRGPHFMNWHSLIILVSSKRGGFQPNLRMSTFKEF